MPELLEDLTVEGVEEILRDPQVRQLDNIGKLERDNRWYFVALITAREAELFTLPYENRQTVQRLILGFPGLQSRAGKNITTVLR